MSETMTRADLIADLIESTILDPTRQVRVERATVLGSIYDDDGAQVLAQRPLVELFEFGDLEPGEDHDGVSGYLPAPFDWPGDVLELGGWLADQLDALGVVAHV